jgi:hypothetical protein
MTRTIKLNFFIKILFATLLNIFLVSCKSGSGGGSTNNNTPATPTNFLIVGNDGLINHYSYPSNQLTNVLFPVQYNKIHYCNDKFIATGYLSTIRISMDGESWTSPASNVIANLNSV